MGLSGSGVLVRVSALLLITTLGVVHGKKVTQVGGPCGWADGCVDFNYWALTTPLSDKKSVSFRYSNFQNVFQFDDKAAYDACDISRGKYLSAPGINSVTNDPNGYSSGRGDGVIVAVNSTAKYIACTTPADRVPPGPPSRCLNGMKVVIQAGYGAKRLFFLDWVLGGLVDYQAEVDKKPNYQIGDAFVFKYSCCHNVKTMTSLANYEACNFTGGVELGGLTAQAVVVKITDQPTYLGCSIGRHCAGGMKVKLPAAKKPGDKA